MAKVTSKYQVTIPKALADRFGIRPGDDIAWEDAGEWIRVRSGVASPGALSRELRLQLFDRATARQTKRQKARGPTAKPRNRGWRREDLYDRGRTR